MENCAIKVDFWPADLHEISDCHGNVNYRSFTRSGDIKLSAADK